MTTDTLTPTTYVELVNIAERGLMSILMDAAHPDFFDACKFVLLTLGKSRGYTMELRQGTCWDVPQTKERRDQEHKQMQQAVMGLNTNSDEDGVRT